MPSLKRPEPPRCRVHPRIRSGCTVCRTWKNWYQSDRYRRTKLGILELRRPAGPVYAHLDKLLATMTVATVAARSGVPDSTLRSLLKERSDDRLVAPVTADAILGVQAAVTADTRIDATGTRRRLQALAAAAWSWGDLAGVFGRTRNTVEKWARAETVTYRVASTVTDVYRAYGEKTGPSPMAGHMARAKGWCDHWAWDDDTIDDPAARPHQGLPQPDRDEVDNTRVLLAVTGGLPYTDLTHAERVEAITYLAGHCRMPHHEIAERLAWPPTGLAKFCSRYGIQGLPSGRETVGIAA